MKSAPSVTWRLADIPDQAGRTIVVTGTTLGGLGHHTALELARRGARVVLAGRSQAKLVETERAIREEVAGAALEQLTVDLSSLDSVRSAAAGAARLGPIHVLVNNAGVMGTTHQRTDDGLELQLATNHFGPFLLTGLLLPQLVASEDARVVAVASQFHRYARSAPLGDPRQQDGRYSRWPAYAQTKLANLLFTYELQRRLTAKGTPTVALAAHPGFSDTELMRHLPGFIPDFLWRPFTQPADMGALPTLRAATDPGAQGGQYYGPDGIGESTGHPKVVKSSAQSHDEDIQRRLWTMSEELTGVTYPV